MILMTQLSRKIRDYWFEWTEEYEQVLLNNLSCFNIAEFDQNTSKSLLKNSLYTYLSLNVVINEQREFDEYVNFVEN